MPSQAIAKRQEAGALVPMTDAIDYAIMSTDVTELKEAIQAATNGQRIDAFQLDMVKVPSGGITQWTIPDIIDGERYDKRIEGIVVLQRTIRSWWKLGFDEKGGTGTQPPDCSSQDGIWGVGHPDGHPDLVESDAPEFAYEAFDADGNQIGGKKAPTRYACEACPLAQFGSGKNQRGQACRQNRLVFLLTQDSALPIVIKVPPSSLKLVQGFLLKMSGKAIKPWGAVLAFELRKTQNSGGIDYSEIVPKFVAQLDPDAVKRIESTAEVLGPSLLGAQAVADL
jgi:hypothetical protein